MTDHRCPRGVSIHDPDGDRLRHDRSYELADGGRLDLWLARGAIRRTTDSEKSEPPETERETT